MEVGCLDLEEKHKIQEDIMKYLVDKLKSLESTQLKLSTEIIQEKKDAAVPYSSIL